MFAKLAGLGVTAFIFEVTKPQLLQMAWFRWLYGRVLVWLDWAHGLTDPIKERLVRLSRLLTPGRGGRALRLLWRIRRRRINAARGRRGASPSMQRQQVRRNQAKCHEGDAKQAEPASQIGQHHHAGDHRRRRQHDADLECGGCKLVVMIPGERFIALVLLLDGAMRQLGRAFALAAGGLGSER